MMPSRGVGGVEGRQPRSPHSGCGMGERRSPRLQPAARCLVPAQRLVRARSLVPAAACLLLALLAPALVAAKPVRLSSDYDFDYDLDFELEEPRRDRYFANDSLLNLPLRCTDEEKECLRYNRLLLPSDGRCYALGDGPGRCRFAADRCEFRRTGHLRGMCAPTDLCRPFNDNKVRMAYDGQCLRPREVLRTCGPGPVNLVQHFFGDSECAPVPGLSPPAPRFVAQPARRGLCAFPNLRHDLTSVTNEERRPRFRPCSQQQSMCFARKRVWLAANRSCSALLAPCGAGEWLALNRSAWVEGRVEAACAPVHPCGSGARLMAFDRRCYDNHTVLFKLCPGGALLPNAFGEMTCVTSHYYRHVIDLISTRPEACEMSQSVSFSGDPVAAQLVPDCALNEDGRCNFF